MSSVKENIVTIAANISAVRPGDTIKLLTAAGVIEGRVVREFDESMPDNLKINAEVLDVAAEALGPESVSGSCIFLTDAYLINLHSRIALGNLITFTEEVIAFLL